MAPKTLVEVPVGDLFPNPWDPRSTRAEADIASMAASIAELGLLQSLMGRLRADRKVELAFGMTRHLAICQLAQDGKWEGGIPVEMRALTDPEMAIIALTENAKRTDLTPLELIRGYQQALKTARGLTITTLADSLQQDRSTLSNNLRILTLPQLVLARVEGGECSPHAAREFLCLMNEDHCHEAEMAHVVKEIAERGFGGAPDWRVGNVRRLVRLLVARKFEDGWRPLGASTDDAESYPGSGGSRESTFDLEAFTQEFPNHIHSIPRDRGDSARPWTCNVKEWRRRQTAATRQENKAVEAGKAPAPSPQTPQQERLQKALAADPVVRQAVKRAEKMAAAPVSEATVPAATTLHSREPEEHPGLVRLEYETYSKDGTAPRFVYIAAAWVTNCELAKEEEVGGMNGKAGSVSWKMPGGRFDHGAIVTMESYEALQAAMAAPVPAAEETVNETPESVQETGGSVHDEAETVQKGAKPVSIATLSKEQREELGTRGKVLNTSRVKGFHQLLEKGYNGVPAYFTDPAECKRCTTGATLCEAYQGGEVRLHCLNEQCYNEKLERGKAEVRKTMGPVIAAQDAEDQQVATVIAAQFSSPNQARVVALGLALALGQSDFRASYYQHERDFRYIPQSLSMLRELLGFKTPGKDAYSEIQGDVVSAIYKAPPDRIPHIAGQLIAWLLRAKDPERMKHYAKLVLGEQKGDKKNEQKVEPGRPEGQGKAARGQRPGPQGGS